LAEQEQRDEHEGEPPEEKHLGVVSHCDGQEHAEEHAVKDIGLESRHEEEQTQRDLCRVDCCEVEGLTQNPFQSTVANREKMIESTS
jgi:hypothetical protein